MLTRKGLWIRIKIYGKRYPEGPRSCKLGIGKSIPAPMSPVLILAEVTSRSKLENSPEGKETGATWHKRRQKAQTSYCSTNLPTVSTYTLSETTRTLLRAS